MASKERLKTKYPGVWYADQNGVRTFYINYRKPGDRKKIEEKLGTSAQGWSAAKANAERTNRINGQAMTNAERRKSQQAAKQAELENPTINDLFLGTDQGDRFRFAVATDAKGEDELNTALNDAIAGVDEKNCKTSVKSRTSRFGGAMNV